LFSLLILGTPGIKTMLNEIPKSNVLLKQADK